MSFLNNYAITRRLLKKFEPYRKSKNLYFVVPLFGFILSLSLPSEITNELFYGVTTGLCCASMLYRFRWIPEVMHRKPTYIESATTFKTNIVGKHSETFDEQLVHEIDHVLTRRFRGVFIHVIIFIDSICVGILGYWAYIHTEGRDPDHWIKNLGFIGGYLMFFKQVHYYSGKLVLWMLKNRKKTAHSIELHRRRSNSDSKSAPSPILEALKSRQGCTIPIVRSMNNFSLCGHEISPETTPSLNTEPPPLKL